ncbi:acetyl-CoA carboxylase biotin carboxylase subunit [Liberiplasma polymorphum]|uniref:acetyl-CoA carboxylase biotin carboxylase subunit n=1 Tax=Liberiplasma polymorphum TaxID=3374570 RepID=UPI003773CF16
MLHKVLIANRGEIAVRIIRACKQMGIETVAVYSKADKDSLHVHIADEAVCIGDNAASASYLNMENIISAAINTGAEAIHPGFGFLSENAQFAELCESCGIIFVGPKSNVISKMGDKAMAKKLMREAGVPCVPGSEGEVTLEEGKKILEEIGVPILIKASAGGGGRGMRIVRNKSEYEKAYRAAKQEAAAAFKHDGVYIEKLVENPKHIEVQILADKYGAIIHLGERDCSVQRRNQKVVEEAPSSIPTEMKEAMYEAAIKAAEFVKYENAGTIEFIVDKDGFYFIEMNTRIQVEHPVTEMITGIDIVKEQLRIAAGRHLKYKQEDVKFTGHAIEVRINAEDPKHQFRPSPGLIEMLHVPQGLGIRFDSMIYTDYVIPPFYDSMIGKVIVHGYSRLDAIRKMRATLEELIIEGVPNNQTFLTMILMHPDFVKGDFDTGFIEKNLEGLLDYET